MALLDDAYETAPTVRDTQVDQIAEIVSRLQQEKRALQNQLDELRAGLSKVIEIAQNGPQGNPRNKW